MDRRELIKFIAAATGIAFVGANASAYDILPDVPLKDTGFCDDDVAFLNEVGETILPRTDTPGAKDANVGRIMAVMVSDCYAPAQQKTFIDGMDKLKAYAKFTYDKEFRSLSAEQRLTLLTVLDDEAKTYNASSRLHENGAAPHYFSLMKQLVLFGFFTSEIGATRVLRYVATPGYYDGDFPYKDGDRAWAT